MKEHHIHGCKVLPKSCTCVRPLHKDIPNTINYCLSKHVRPKEAWFLEHVFVTVVSSLHPPRALQTRHPVHHVLTADLDDDLAGRVALVHESMRLPAHHPRSCNKLMLF